VSAMSDYVNNALSELRNDTVAQLNAARLEHASLSERLASVKKSIDALAGAITAIDSSAKAAGDAIAKFDAAAEEAIRKGEALSKTKAPKPEPPKLKTVEES